MAGNLQAAYNWAIQECNAPNRQYSLTLRGGNYGGIQYWDCSSFIGEALAQGGYFDYNPLFTTGSMWSYLESAGFTLVADFYPNDMPSTFELRNGDILLIGAEHYPVYSDSNDVGHTEMVYDAGQRMCMGAHYHSESNPDQDVSIRDYYGSADAHDWYYVWRDLNSPEPFPDGSVGPGGGGAMVPITADMLPVANGSGFNWHTNSVYGWDRESDEAIENAKIITWFLYRAGWSAMSIAAFLGNVTSECGLDPELTEYQGYGGYGLVQWTPKTDLTQAIVMVYGAESAGLENDGTRQMNVILAEYAQQNYITSDTSDDSFARDFHMDVQWLPSSGSLYGFSYTPISYYQWAKNSEGYTVADLTKIYMVGYERPDYSVNKNHWPARVDNAEYWYGLIPGFIAGFNWGGIKKKKRRKMPLWMMLYPW